MQRPVFIGNDIYRHSSLGGKHPLSIPRVSTVMDLCRALGWLDQGNYRESRPATPDELGIFHCPDYVAAVMAAERSLAVPAEESIRYNIGRGGNPVYSTMFRRPATGVGGSLMAARWLREAGGIIYSPGGGTHHGMRAQASGFCYFNDAAVAISDWLASGLSRIAYIDLDVHHGDGVQAAFEADPRVMFVSVHEAGRWPFSGSFETTGCGNLFNFPVPPGMHDDELRLLMEAAILPVVQRFAPEAMLIQCGADALAEDPLAKQQLGNGALWQAVAALRPLAPRLLVTGGGGYNPWSVARCWTGIWARLNDLEIPDRLPEGGQAVLKALTWNRAAGRSPPPHWWETLADPWRGGEIRPELRMMAQAARARGLG